MALITITEAARRGWSSRPTIARRIKTGLLSVERRPDGRVLLDPSELDRVFGAPGQSMGVTGVPERAELGASERSTLLQENERLIAEAVDARAELRQEREHVRQERDRLLSMLEQAQRSLTDQRPPAQPGWWRRVFGG